VITTKIKSSLMGFERYAGFVKYLGTNMVGLLVKLIAGSIHEYYD